MMHTDTQIDDKLSGVPLFTLSNEMKIDYSASTRAINHFFDLRRRDIDED
jgi:hypothetical protein